MRTPRWRLGFVLAAALLCAACGPVPGPASGGPPPSEPPSSELPSDLPSLPVSSATAAMSWTGTMTGTDTWTRQGSRGTTTATFTGTWEPVPNDGQAQPCTPVLDTCMAFYPHGTIHWTWDSSQDTPPCSAKTDGDAQAGAGNTPSSAVFGETLYLQPDGSGNFDYWGDGIWLAPQPACANGDAAAPPAYFGIPQTATGGSPAPDSLCHQATWQIPEAATTISGSCFSFNPPGHSLKFEWSLARGG